MKGVKENNVTVVVLIVLLTMIIGVSLSYAFFSARISGTESESTIVMEAGTLSIEYTDLSNTISISNVYPREEEWVTKEFKVTGTNTSDLALFYKIVIVLDNNEFEGLGLSYSLESENTGNNGSVIPNISKEYIARENINLGQGYFVNTGDSSKEHKYTLKIYFKDPGYDQNYLQGAKFAAHIEIEAGNKAVETAPKGWDEAGSGTLLAGIKTNYPSVMQQLTNPGKEASTETEAVLAGTADDYGMSYYFRGNVINNYVQFANKCWRIVRITGDGSIKLVLHNDNVNNVANPCASSNNSDDAAYARYDGTNYETAFSSEYIDNSNIGFMYGTAGSSTYAATHANINKSAILQNLETWYNNNLASYESKLADTIWCNDKSIAKNLSVIFTSQDDLLKGIPPEENIYPGLGYGENETYYSATPRYQSLYFFDGNDDIKSSAGTGPTLICPEDNDGGKLSKFTVSDLNNGNGALNYKIGLLTYDEVSFAGVISYYLYETFNYNSSLISNYMYENAKVNDWWTLSPMVGTDGAMIISVGNDSDHNNNFILYEETVVPIALRPAISLKNTTTISGGTGTSSNPFVVN